ncbi:hypothetical protein K435DRAFT_727062 [Dendrothele bispora CBS 962.96]|uniref:HNH nuclease domain-containing protein n=1 Tax=Dendrothele bispora (strain CBS 962.96) TaxID=1314807 RepID=A0A4S8LRI1_DENBC|nr:hypothetical protein K435DRAFT_727062 [Dendrothele bispora CBS 962.96]
MNVFPLPLPDLCPFPYPNVDQISNSSRSSAFETGIDVRDVFNGSPACVFCGVNSPLEHAHIVPRVERNTWSELKDRGWVPHRAKDVVKEPRNGILLCRNCHGHFDELRIFVRYLPEAAKFVFINFDNIPHQPYVTLHQKAIGLQPADFHAPMACLFLIHECRVRGHYPFRQNPTLPQDIQWAQWITIDGNGNIQRGGQLPQAPPSQAPPSPAPEEGADSDGPESEGTDDSGGAGREGGMMELTLDQNTIEQIVRASRAQPSWKACMVEGSSWEGSAEENIAKYKATIGF